VKPRIYDQRYNATYSKKKTLKIRYLKSLILYLISILY